MKKLLLLSTLLTFGSSGWAKDPTPSTIKKERQEFRQSRHANKQKLKEEKKTRKEAVSSGEINKKKALKDRKIRKKRTTRRKK